VKLLMKKITIHCYREIFLSHLGGICKSVNKVHAKLTIIES
jgi:hypothetical protein